MTQVYAEQSALGFVRNILLM